MGGLHSGETGPSEMLMELVYRLATETSPIVDRIRDNVYVSITPDADADGRDRNVDWYYQTLARTDSDSAAARAARGTAPGTATGVARAGAAEVDGDAGPRRRTATPPPAGGAASADAARRCPTGASTSTTTTIATSTSSLQQMRAIADWYFTAHPPIMHDLHESETLMYDYSGGPPQNPEPRPDPLRRAAWYANFELSQMTKWGMPGVYDLRLHGRLVARLPRLAGVQPQRHDEDVRDAVGPGHHRPATHRGAGRGAGRRPRARQRRFRVRRAAAGRGGRGAPGGRGAGVPGAGRGGPDGPGGVPTGKGGTQDREWYRGLPVGPDGRRQLLAPGQHQLHGDRRPLGAGTDGDVPGHGARGLRHHDAQLDRRRGTQGAACLPDSGAPRHDARRTAGEHPPDPGDRGRPYHGRRCTSATRRTPPGRT